MWALIHLTTLMSFRKNAEPLGAWVSFHGMRELLFPGYWRSGYGSLLSSYLENPMDRLDRRLASYSLWGYKVEQD